MSLVLAAARQLGMAIRRDVKLLWIADEALVDEYDEEEEDESDSDDDLPLASLAPKRARAKKKRELFMFFKGSFRLKQHATW